VQAGPLIIEPGAKPGIYQDTKKYRSRTALGIAPQGQVIVICTFRQGTGEEDLSGLGEHHPPIQQVQRERHLGVIQARSATVPQGDLAIVADGEDPLRIA